MPNLLARRGVHFICTKCKKDFTKGGLAQPQKVEAACMMADGKPLFSHRNKLCPHFAKPQPKEPQQESWRKELKKRYKVLLLSSKEDGSTYGQGNEAIESFIENLLTQEKERAYGSGWKHGLRDAQKPTMVGIRLIEESQAKELGRVEERARLRKIVEGLKAPEHEDYVCDDEVDGFNEAKTQLLGEMRGEE